MFSKESGDKQQKDINVAGYARVSTDEQAKGHSTETQIHYLKEWCKQNNWNYTKSYIDNGFSGGNDNRPDLQQMIKDGEENKFNAILITNTDRLSRDPDYSIQFFKDIFKENIGIGIISMQAHGIITNLDDPSLDLTIRMFGMFDGYFRKLTIFKTKAGMKRLSDQGRHMGRPPTFFKINKRSGKLVIDDEVLLFRFRQAMVTSPKPSKRPYGYYSRLSKELGIPYKRLNFAVKDYDKYKDITK